jgi:hypothetical protein
LHPGEQVAGEGDEGAPDLVGREVVKRRLASPVSMAAMEPLLAMFQPPKNHGHARRSASAPFVP